MKLFRHRKQIRKHENAHKLHQKRYSLGHVKNLRIGAAGTPNAGKFLGKSKNITEL